MNKLFTILLASFSIGLLHAQTNVSGNQNGTWAKANSPYVITGNITVPNGQTLIIEAGVEVQFSNGNNTVSEFLVNGTLKAIGTATDSIKFTGGDFSYGSQRGPITIASSSTNSQLQYISASGLGFYFTSNEAAVIYVNSSSCSISNCSFKNINASVISINSSSTIINAVTKNWFNEPSIRYYSILLDIDKVKYIKGNYSNSSDSVEIGLNHNYAMNQNDTLYFGYNYSLLNNQTVELSKTLTIAPGVNIYFLNGNNLTSQLDVKGTLKAIGTASDFIYFNGDGNFSNGVHSQGYSYGSQQGPVIIEKTSNSSIIQYATINDLGYYFNGDFTPAIIVSSNSCKILNNSIVNINGSGSALQIDQCSPDISNNNFSNTGLDVICDLDKIRDLKNNNPLKIGLTKQADMGFNDTLTANNISYRILTNQTVAKSKILTIEPGVTLQFTNGNNTVSQLIVEGTLNAQGTASTYISFTGGGFSYGSQRGPITIDTSSKNSVLKYISVSDLGYYFNNSTSTPIIQVNSSSCTISNCNITDNSGIAISIKNASPAFSRNCIFSNSSGVLSNGGSPVFNECNFVGNTSYGINNTNSSDTVKAINCFWGDASGPTDPIGNPGGSGDLVSGNVIYKPWATDQFDCSEEVMPVTLLNFNAIYSSAKLISCAWQTATESNSGYFTVQRSTNGISFTDIAKVNAAGNSNAIRSYSYPDNTFNETGVSKLYYRLQEVDVDGKKQFSNIVSVNLENENKMFIYPVPANNTLHISLTRPLSQNASVILYDINGKIVLQQKAMINSTSQQLNVSALAEGNYNVVIIDNGKKVSNSQIVIMHQ